MSSPATDPPAETNQNPPRRKGRWLWITLGVLLVLAVEGGVWVYIRYRDAGKKPAGPAAKITITTATAVRGDIGVYLDEIGTVTPVYTASIVSQVNGVILQVHYKEGELVNKGDTLIDIDPRPYQATLVQAQGALQRDQNLLAQAQMDLDRYKAAWARNAIARQTLDDQEKLVAQDQGTVKNDQGAVDYDKVELGFCHITAPIAGQVGLRLVDPGNTVQSTGATTLAVITQLTPITVVFTIPEVNVGQVQARIKAGARLPVDAYDATGATKIASGQLLTLDNQIDTTTGTIKARAQFDNKDGRLVPNQFVNVRLLLDTLTGVTLIPDSAVQQNGTASFLYVVQEGVAHKVGVKTGVDDSGLQQVTGINPGDVVADSSFDKLRDKAEVAATTEKPTAPTTQTASPGTAAEPGGAAGGSGP